MLTTFTLLAAIALLFAWTFEMKPTLNFKYPAVFTFFFVLTFIAIPYSTYLFLKVMSVMYPFLSTHANYQTGLLASVIILGIAFVVKVSNKYLPPSNNSDQVKK